MHLSLFIVIYEIIYIEMIQILFVENHVLVIPIYIW